VKSYSDKGETRSAQRVADNFQIDADQKPIAIQANRDSLYGVYMEREVWQSPGTNQREREREYHMKIAAPETCRYFN